MIEKRFDPDVTVMSDLTQVLGKSAPPALLRDLCLAAQQFAQSESGERHATEKRRRDARREAKLAGQLERILGTLHPDLERAFGVVLASESLRELFGENQRRYPLSLVMEPGHSFDSDPTRLVTRLLELLPEVHHRLRMWRERAASRGRARPGPKRDLRRSLGAYVGYKLKRAGVPLKMSADGTFAKVLSVVYDAAGLTVPEDMFREVRMIVEDPNERILPAVRVVLQDRRRPAR